MFYKFTSFLITINLLLLLLNFHFTYSLKPSDDSIQSNSTISALDTGLQKCQKLPSLTDPCTYTRNECKYLTEGLVDYLDLYYCRLSPNLGSIVGLFVLFVILILAFMFLSTIASGFFCPNLAALAESLNLSENVAGVTFLAFGNGSPDLFSTFSSFKAQSGALAIGELIGASWFIVSVVVGSMAVITSFQVVKYLFLRDIIFFTGAILFMLMIIWDQVLSPWEALFLTFYYLFYVFVVVFFTPNPNPGEINSNFFQKLFFWKQFDIINDEEEIESLLLSNFESEPSEETGRLISQLTLNSLSSPKSNLPLVTPLTYYKRINFWTADEITQALQTSSVEIVPSSAGTKRGVGFHPFSANVSNYPTNDVTSILPERSRAHTSSQLPQLHITSYEPLPQRSPGHFKRSNAPSSIFIPTPDTPSPFQRSQLPESDPETEIESPLEISTQYSTLGSTLKNLLLPDLMEWENLSYMERLFNLLNLPSMLLLILTVPVPTESNPDCKVDSQNTITNNIEPIYVKMFGSKVSSELILGCLQSLFIPIFLFEIFFVNYDILPQTYIYVSILLGFSAALGYCKLNCILHKIMPSSVISPLFSFLGFVLALSWISMIATEIVDILKTAGIVLGIREEIIGLTVFAMGNSLGDFVANLSVARMGFPTMAVSACFAGPMLSPGFAGAYYGFKDGQSINILVSPIMSHAAIGVLVTLVLYIFYMFYSGFKIDRFFGFILISIYLVGMTSNLLMN